MSTRVSRRNSLDIGYQAKKSFTSLQQDENVENGSEMSTKRRRQTCPSPKSPSWCTNEILISFPKKTIGPIVSEVKVDDHQEPEPQVISSIPFAPFTETIPEDSETIEMTNIYETNELIDTHFNEDMLSSDPIYFHYDGEDGSDPISIENNRITESALIIDSFDQNDIVKESEEAVSQATIQYTYNTIQSDHTVTEQTDVLPETLQTPSLELDYNAIESKASRRKSVMSGGTRRSARLSLAYTPGIAMPLIDIAAEETVRVDENSNLITIPSEELIPVIDVEIPLNVASRKGSRRKSVISSKSKKGKSTICEKIDTDVLVTEVSESQEIIQINSTTSNNVINSLEMSNEIVVNEVASVEVDSAPIVSVEEPYVDFPVSAVRRSGRRRSVISYDLPVKRSRRASVLPSIIQENKEPINEVLEPVIDVKEPLEIHTEDQLAVPINTDSETNSVVSEEITEAIQKCDNPEESSAIVNDDIVHEESTSSDFVETFANPFDFVNAMQVNTYLPIITIEEPQTPTVVATPSPKVNSSSRKYRGKSYGLGRRQSLMNSKSPLIKKKSDTREDTLKAIDEDMEDSEVAVMDAMETTDSIEGPCIPEACNNLMMDFQSGVELEIVNASNSEVIFNINDNTDFVAEPTNSVETIVVDTSSDFIGVDAEVVIEPPNQEFIAIEQHLLEVSSIENSSTSVVVVSAAPVVRRSGRSRVSKLPSISEDAPLPDNIVSSSSLQKKKLPAKPKAPRAKKEREVEELDFTGHIEFEEITASNTLNNGTIGLSQESDRSLSDSVMRSATKKNVLFGSPDAVEFNKTKPTTNLTPLARSQVKLLFSMEMKAFSTVLN